MAPSAPHIDAEQLDLSDDAASDRHASIQESCPNVEVPDTWSADHLAEMQKADPEIGIIYRWLEEGKVPSPAMGFSRSLERLDFLSDF